ncbi:MAG: hypothetical protein KJ697_03720 [Nanoarchaeota archaeon]|nr:hypothetical protein [Nanoarchaeota archaeon]MBU4124492.1 hypothetical protein [Nanoarchaeota archaeon]
MPSPEEKAKREENLRNAHKYKPKETGTVYAKPIDTTHKRNSKPIYPEY